MAAEQPHADLQLAFRTERQFFNAYLEWQGSAQHLQFVGSINRMVCEGDPAVYAAWRALMLSAVTRFAERLSGEKTEIIGTRPVCAGGTA